MQLTISASQQQAQLDFSQHSLNQSTKTTSPPLLPQRDRVELSDESRKTPDDGHTVEHLRKSHYTRSENQLFDFLKSMLEQISGAQINDLKQVPPASDSAQNQQISLAEQQSSLSVETSTLSIDGSITTADGTELAFSLDLQVLHASASSSVFNFGASHYGYDFNYAGSSTELTSTSFSFSLTAATPDGASATGSGLGTFSLKDELKDFRHALKPLIKDFLQEAGIPSDKRSVNQLLKTIA
jgi:hypothetical protein